MSDFSIGTSYATLTTLDTLGVTEPNQDPFVSARIDRDQADGFVSEHGWGETGWRWGFLRISHLAILRAFCPGKSAEVYVEIYNTDDAAWEVYRAVMIWPKPIPTPVSNAVVDFSLTFRLLQNIPEYYI